MLEAYVRHLMIQQARKFQVRPCVGKEDYEKVSWVTLGGCTSIRLVVDMADADTKHGLSLPHSWIV